MGIKQTLSRLAETKWFFPLLIALLWITAIFVVNPFAEFPLNDDWAYTKNVFQLSENHKFYVDSWPAMTLISQTLYGFLFTKLFGFSFSILRISVLILAFFSTIVLFMILKKKCNNNYLAFLLSCGFCFGQVFCALSFTFMTDIFFLSFTIFSIYSLLQYLHHKKTKHYLFFIFFCVIAILNRQHGLLLPLLIIPPLLFKTRPTVKIILTAIFPFIVGMAAHLGYQFFMSFYSVPQNIQGLAKLTAAIKNIDFEQTHIRTGDIFLCAGWMLLPCSLVLLWKRREKSLKKIILFGSIVLIVLGISWAALKIYPWGNISTLNGIGPKILKDYLLNIANRFNVPEWLRWTVRSISFLSVCYLVFNAITNRNEDTGQKKNPDPFTFSICFFIAVYLLFSVINEAYFDRYVLPMGFFLLLLSVPQYAVLKPSFKIPLTMLVMLLYVVTILEVKDYMNWNRARWRALAGLYSKGINANYIDGGFEFNAWFKPGKGFSPDYENKSWYWVDRDDFLIANGNYPGYFIKDHYTYRHYIPFTTDTLFVLEKKDKNPFDIKKFNEKVKKFEDQIRNDKNWLDANKKQAIENHISLDSTIRLNAVWMAHNFKEEVPATEKEKITATEYQSKVAEFEAQIRNNKDWLDASKKQSVENHISLDSMIRLNAVWMVEHTGKK